MKTLKKDCILKLNYDNVLNSDDFRELYKKIKN